MISHRHGFATTRRACEQLHPGRAWRRGSPATYSRLRATRVAEPAGCGWMPLRPVSEVLPGRRRWARRSGSLPELNMNHDAGSSPCVVVCAAGSPRSCQRRGARFGLLPRTERYPIHYLRSRRADALEVVAHASASSFPSSRLRLPGPSVSTSESRAFASTPLCSSHRTSQRSRRECATTSHEITTDRRAHFVLRRA